MTCDDTIPNGIYSLFSSNFEAMLNASELPENME